MPLNDPLDLKGLPPKEQERILSGMRSPQVVTLHAGEIIYHFASTEGKTKTDLVSIPPSRWTAGAWWTYERDFRRIVAQHLDSGWSLGLTARSANAIQQSWSRVDVLVEAIVIKDINAFAGPGRTQHREMAPNGMYITLPGWPDVTQLYIPNIVDRHGLTALGREALDVRSQGVIDSQQLYPLV
jgi:hypothetical protein